MEKRITQNGNSQKLWKSESNSVFSVFPSSSFSEGYNIKGRSCKTHDQWQVSGEQKLYK